MLFEASDSYEQHPRPPPRPMLAPLTDESISLPITWVASVLTTKQRRGATRSAVRHAIPFRATYVAVWETLGG